MVMTAGWTAGRDETAADDDARVAGCDEPAAELVALPADDEAVVGTVAFDDDEVPQAVSAATPRIPAIPRQIRCRQGTPLSCTAMVRSC